MKKRTQHTKLFKQQLILLISLGALIIGTIGFTVYQKIHNNFVNNAGKKTISNLVDTKKTRKLNTISKVGYIMTCADQLNTNLSLNDLKVKINDLVPVARTLSRTPSPTLKKKTIEKITKLLKLIKSYNEKYTLKKATETVSNLEKIISSAEKEIETRQKLEQQFTDLKNLISQMQEIIADPDTTENQRKELASYSEDANKFMKDEESTENGLHKLVSKIQNALPKITNEIKKVHEEKEKKNKEKEKDEDEKKRKTNQKSPESKNTTEIITENEISTEQQNEDSKDVNPSVHTEHSKSSVPPKEPVISPSTSTTTSSSEAEGTVPKNSQNKTESLPS